MVSVVRGFASGHVPVRAKRAVSSTSYRIQRVAGRSIGEVKEGSHLRSGKPGQWREVLSPKNMALFRELTGDLVERLGYV
jgi:hypothetical protein